MVSTRKSTGSLPAPKRKNLAESDIDEDGFSDESVPERPAKKRAKKAQALKRVGADGDDGDNDGDAVDSKQSKKRKIDVSEDESDAVASASTDIVKKSNERMDSLITGPESKNVKKLSTGTPPPKKKMRVRKDDVGRLARMVDLPVEIFCEIASYFKPKDLLLLSRSSRIMRDLLMSKSSRSIWTASEAATGMPPCPSDMSEPQYANLYFEKDCHACGYPRVDRLTDHLRIRLCKGCHQLNLFKGSSLAKEFFGPKVSKMYEIYSLIPWNNMYNDGTSQNRVDSRIQNRHFLKYDFIKVVSAYLKTKADSEERESFVKKQHQLVNDIAKSVRDVASWRGGQYWERAGIEKELKVKRREQIFEKLRGLGYADEELEGMSYRCYSVSRSWTQLVNQPRELTDRIWKNIRPQLEDLLLEKRKREAREKINKNRQARKGELLELYKKYVEKHGWRGRTNQAPLCFDDLWEAPDVSQIVEQNKCEDVLTEESWKPIEEKLPEIAEEHARRVERECMALLSPAREIDALEEINLPAIIEETDFDDDPSILLKANALFVRGWIFYSFVDLIRERDTHMLNATYFSPHRWNVNDFLPDSFLTRTADSLLSSLSLPLDTSMEHMVSLGQSFVCQRCDPLFREPMTWIKLVKHTYIECKEYSRLTDIDALILDTHNIESEAPLAIINPDLIKASTESFTLFPDEHSSPKGKACTYCRRSGTMNVFLYKEQFAAHIRSVHGIVDPTDA